VPTARPGARQQVGLTSMDFKDYYTTLGVPKDATDADIKKA
jgi:hypothetical protein